MTRFGVNAIGSENTSGTLFDSSSKNGAGSGLGTVSTINPEIVEDAARYVVEADDDDDFDGAADNDGLGGAANDDGFDEEDLLD